MDIIIYKDGDWGCSNIVKRGVNLLAVSETSYRRIIKYEIRSLFTFSGEFRNGDNVDIIVKSGSSIKGFKGVVTDLKVVKDVIVSSELSKEDINRIINKIKIKWLE